MRKTILVLAAALLACAAPAVAAGGSTDKKDVMAVIKQFCDGLNKNDTKSSVAACADEAIIIDEFPPHVWSGAGACQKWVDDFGADAQKKGITDPFVTVGKANVLDVSGDRAYVVVPTTYSFKEKGKAMREAHAFLTVALQKVTSGWRITGWSWSKG
jgi:ketosteroid isomerase-like protein